MIPIEPWSDADDGGPNNDGGAEIRLGVDRRRLVPLLIGALAVLLVVSYLVGRQPVSEASPATSAMRPSDVTEPSVTSRVIPPVTTAPAAGGSEHLR